MGLLVDSEPHSIRLEGDTASLSERWVTPYTKRSGVRGLENDKKPYLSPQPEGMCRSFAFALGFAFFPLLGGQRRA